MKKILIFLFTIISIGAFSQGAFQSDGRFAPTGNYFITKFGEAQTGFWPLTRYTQRDSIPTWQRTYGMIVHVADRDSCYQLKSVSLDNSNWFAFKLGSVDLTAYYTQSQVNTLLAAKQDALGFTAVPNTRTINSYPLSSNITLTKSDVGLGNVTNTDATNPANITQSSSYRFASDAEKATWNAKQSALGFTPENVANKATDFTTVNNTLYPTVSAVKTYADALVVGLLNDRGNYNASGNTFPSSGGSGSGGAIQKGDIWFINVAGTLGGTAVSVGDQIRALVNSPGQTASNWVISAASVGYVPENTANKSTSTSLGTSNTLFPTQGAVKSYVDNTVANYVPTTRTINGFDLSANRTLNTDNIGEGTTNLYFTNARARAALSAGTGLSYNNTTGQFTNTITNTNQLTNGAGFLTANQAITLTATGDATGTSTASGTSPSIALTLANSGVTAGTYTKLTVDAKGRATAGASLASADVTTALGYTPYNSTNPNGFITGITAAMVNAVGAITNSTSGNAATATNSTQWGGYSNNIGDGPYSGAPDHVAGFSGTTLQRYNAAAIQSFLGLGSYAYRSSGLAELTGANFSGNISAPVVSYGSGSQTASLSYGSGFVTLEASSANTSINMYPSGTGFFKVPNRPIRVGSPGSLPDWQMGQFENAIGIAANGSRAALYAYTDGNYFGINAYDYANGVYKDVSVGWGGQANVYLIREGGKVGIATTSPNRLLEAANSSGSVFGLANSTSGGGSNILYGRIAMYSTAFSNAYIDYGGEIRSYSGGGVDYSDLRFYTAAGSTSTEKLRLTDIGNFGLGTTSPVNYSNYRSFHIAGPNSTGSAMLYLTNSTSSIRGFLFAEGAAQRVTVGTQSNHDFTIATNDYERLRVTNSGNLLGGYNGDTDVWSVAANGKAKLTDLQGGSGLAVQYHGTDQNWGIPAINSGETKKLISVKIDGTMYHFWAYTTKSAL